jgi:hypothetical protein
MTPLQDAREHAWAEQHEILLKKRNRELYHVTNVFVDADDKRIHYRLEDDTHTTEHYWVQEDLQACFLKTGESCVGKPIQSDDMDIQRYYTND